MSSNRKREKKSSGWGLLVFLVLIFAPEAVGVLIPLIIVGYVAYAVVKSAAAKSGSTSRSYSSATATRTTTRTATRYTTRQEKFDECPQPISCFHRDKGEHHVRKGKEIDPWDRPDIDISKYRRNR